MSEIKLIVGLGNPGREYEDTRHNAGFWWVDQIASRHNVHFREDKAFHGLLARLNIPNQSDIYLLKPQTFMNVSGKSIAAVARFYKINPEEILIAHDELDLAPGIARLKKGGGHGGHNGLKDTIAQLGNKDFWRLRLGVGHPGDRALVSGFVLNKPRQEEREAIEQSMDHASAVWPQIITGKMDAAMLKLHSHK